MFFKGFLAPCFWVTSDKLHSIHSPYICVYTEYSSQTHLSAYGDRRSSPLIKCHAGWHCIMKMERKFNYPRPCCCILIVLQSRSGNSVTTDLNWIQGQCLSDYGAIGKVVVLHTFMEQHYRCIVAVMEGNDYGGQGIFYWQILKKTRSSLGRMYTLR